jgi:membrane protease YdiL (CAAX protease family)
MTSPVGAELLETLISGAVGALLFYIGKKKRFFDLPEGTSSWNPALSFFHVLAAFAIYFGTGYLFQKGVHAYGSVGVVSQDQIISLMVWGNFSCSAAIALLFFSFLLMVPTTQKILHRAPEWNPLSDLGHGLLAWLFAFPLVVFVGQLLDLLLYFLFHTIDLPDQNAVLLFKFSLLQPLYLFLTTVVIVVLAPLVEETLFRGFLQTYLRQRFGSLAAIWVTATAFSFFHFSSLQGLSNIPIIGSLFVLALFLGFLYEKQGSLLAPIALHACFNSISVLNLYYAV